AAIPWREAASLLATAVLLALFLGTRKWLKTNDYAPRYLIPSAMLAQSALAMLIVVPLCGGWLRGGDRRWPLTAMVALLLWLGVVSAYAMPSPRGVRADLDRMGGLTKDLIESG